MKKQILLFALCTLLLANCFAQQVLDKNILYITGGISVPTGSFAGTNPNSAQLGYASLGESVNITYEHKLNSRFGIVATLYGEANALNKNKLAQQLDQTLFEIPVPYPAGTTPPPPQYGKYSNWVVNKSSWYAASFLVGMAIHLPLGFNKTGKLLFTAKATSGAVRLTMPKLYASGSTDSTLTAKQQGRASAFGMSYLLSAGIEYRLTKRLWLEANANYFGTAQISFKNVSEASGFEGHFTSGAIPVGTVAFANFSTATQKQTVGSFNINAGIAFRL